MTSHDLVAELQGYRNELASAERRGDTDRAAAVREEIERIAGLLRGQAAALEAQPPETTPGLARVRAALTELEEAGVADAEETRQTKAKARSRRGGTRANRAGQETAADTTPTETATPSTGSED